MEFLKSDNIISLNLDIPIWDRVFTVAPLVVVGTKENEGYNLAPKHMAMPIGWGNYFGFVCTPKHGTYHNIMRYREFTVSFPRPSQVVTASLSASPRSNDLSKTEATVAALSVQKASTMDAPLIADAYFYLECEQFKIVDGFDENSIIIGKIKAAHVHKAYLRETEKEEREQLYQNPLLAYIAHGRFAEVSETHMFPFPKDFER